MANLDRKRLEAFFRLKDKNNDGCLDLKEITELLNEISDSNPGQLNSRAIDEFLSKYDRDNNRKISLMEFLNGFLDDVPEPINNVNSELRDILTRTFKRIDTNNSGYLEYNEFYSALLQASEEYNLGFTDDLIKAHFRYYDINGDGKISIDEFLKVSIV